MKMGDRVLFDPSTGAIEPAPVDDAAPVERVSALVVHVNGDRCTLYLYPNVPDAVRENVPLPKG